VDITDYKWIDRERDRGTRRERERKRYRDRQRQRDAYAVLGCSEYSTNTLAHLAFRISLMMAGTALIATSIKKHLSARSNDFN